ncbi:hypothetical protein VOLCADRAFT_95899 [Volvox carteri f. nagariensis]|uniref:Uncharacterized protein n=1 Tax=Volvox carteri f. nagariensis TaxID=3068 RepID=D8U8N6_VOLCA|nr:uncharacterized protein VOLCADRAFT_95899 [Volvox carteri f. nagariensis]EFJ44014.1 hypothetical protein VOLCADRAFT_95899 [Volvox carteri f. nagariensis]|eukprot:XP_002955026.1 hypothetical protein VOLCADRAFT_95899 [Volvox carteri f. nagariensis]
MRDFGFPDRTARNNRTSYFSMMLDPCGVGRAMVDTRNTSLNPLIALRSWAMFTCIFAPFSELHAMRWSLRALIEWNKAQFSSMDPINFGNQSYPRGWLPPLQDDPVAGRPFLPDTLKRLTIKRTNDHIHRTSEWRGRPVVSGFLPSTWALLRNLELLDLSDDMGQGAIEGPIPSTWLMMTKLRTMYARDDHRQ